MRSILLSLLSILLLAPSIYGASTDTISTSISEVTLYRSGATISRAHSVSLDAGYNQVVITGLPIGMDAQSLNIFTSNKVVLLSQRAQHDYQSNKGAQTEYERQRLALSDSIDWTTVKINILQGQNDLLSVNKRMPSEHSSPSISELDKLHTYYAQQRLQNEKKIFELSKHSRELEKRLKQIDNNIAAAKRNSSKGETHLVLELEAPRSGLTKIAIEYFVHSAGWTPTYDVRVEDLTSDMDIVYKASMYQNTGEDWQNVDVTLSTAQPQGYYGVPQMHPYYLRQREVYYRDMAMAAPSRQKQSTMSADGQDEAEAAIMADQAVDQYMPEYEVSMMTTSLEYKLDDQYNLASTGVSQTVLLKRESLSAEYEYVCAPKITQNAILTAKIKDWQSLNLIPGQAYIFLENNYVGQTYLNTNTKNDEYLISLGKDDQVKVKRELLKGYKTSKFLGSNKIETRKWEISVHNLKSSPIDVVVYDQYPISQDGSIKVDLKKDGDAKQNEETGELKWSATIEPANEWKKTIEYEVKYPKSRQIHVD